MKPTLSLRFSQHLALTPQLQQSIRLLQLSTLEMQQELEQALAQNPLLERADDPLSLALRMNADGSLQQGGETSANGNSELTRLGTSNAESGDAHQSSTDSLESPASLEESGVYEGTYEGTMEFRRNYEDDDDAPTQLAAQSVSLREHLREQLSLTAASTRDRILIGVLIDALDENGYLSSSLEEILSFLPPEEDVQPEELHTALTLLQSFDPVGIGAQNGVDCLLIQLAHPEIMRWSEAQNPRVLALARQICQSHLTLLANRDYVRLKRLLNCSDDMLRQAQALIQHLNPHPGAVFSSNAADSVVPDVVVRRINNRWTAVLNSEVMPRLQINQLYARILRGQRGNAANASLNSQLQEARWLIRNVQQRFETILRVSEAIVERQRSFFTHGQIAMRPLVLREIADILGLHESTISRVTSQKYMLTPFGTFELKYFFGSHIATDAGGAASSTAIRALIKQMIQNEQASKPLSDTKLSEMLAEQGFVVARRTVAKYRDALKIPAVALRKVL